MTNVMLLRSIPLALLLSATIPAKALWAQTGFLVLPHFAAGDGLVSELTLVNPGLDEARTSIYFFNEDGTSAKDLPDGAFFIVPPNGSYKLRITATGSPRAGSIQTVWAINGTRPSPPILFGSLVISIAGIGSSAVQAGVIGNTFVFPAQKTSELRTGLAIANVCPSSTPPITIILRNDSGLPVGTRSVQLPASGHFAAYIDEIIPTAGSSYSGVVNVSVQTTDTRCVTTLSVAAYDLGTNLGQFIVLPVGKLN